MATELYIQINYNWLPILCIPTNEFVKFTLRPLKWLRFLGCIIYGREGVLRRLPGEPEVDNYDIATPQLLDRYYFCAIGKIYGLSVVLRFSSVSAGQPRFLDIQGLNDREASPTCSRASTRIHFSRELVRRDGTCIVTGEPPGLSNPSHCVPHAKGDDVRLSFGYENSLFHDLLYSISTG